MAKPITSSQANSIGQHEHLTSQILDAATGEVSPPGGATPTLAQVLVTGNDTGETAITAPMGSIVATTAERQFDIFGAAGTGDAAGVSATIGGGSADPTGLGSGGAGLVYGGDGGANVTGGEAGIIGGYGAGGTVHPGRVIADAGNGDGTGGGVRIVTAAAHGASDKNGGDLVVTLGVKDGAGRNGLVFLNLPTSDPGVVGALYDPGTGVRQSGDTEGLARVLAFPFAFDTPSLLTGAAVYTPTVGDILIDAWFEIEAAWDGTTPSGDFGTFVGRDYGNFNSVSYGPIDMSGVALAPNFSAEDRGNILAGMLVGATSNDAVLRFPSLGQGAIATGGTSRILPAKFISADPLLIVVSQDGLSGGADPVATQGSAILYIIVATP